MKFKYCKTGSNDGWIMKQGLYAKCPICGYHMSLNPLTDDICPCENMYKDSAYGRFGAKSGDFTIEIYEKLKEK